MSRSRALLPGRLLVGGVAGWYLSSAWTGYKRQPYPPQGIPSTIGEAVNPFPWVVARWNDGLYSTHRFLFSTKHLEDEKERADPNSPSFLSSVSSSIGQSLYWLWENRVEILQRLMVALEWSWEFVKALLHLTLRVGRAIVASVVWVNEKVNDFLSPSPPKLGGTTEGK
uniref:Uncharacterized protein n=1 Tax=Chromera velia CCMP2878 TaxID=1169474 RepID=A0A0G4HVI4_9ALVE|mmetsp:Transcript_36652/g.72076  ORF Transcript_36652/g.72076 Transcript_36652/m.72076 type:complete len:169 (-) Transcript_36652:40-546(-)|eukprot:Cvel_8863.t1-p1 / transcript=Cvel_8863.t1 / gene=Cvel_8863 / organism=Chromera_velia_CCMP2878 / gene_product=hypothetical protein / transcript_product=hypothetical protein / location=Cvel_scaffold498:41117-43547(+) / protein_length=168 / sequence_SO=supercontig / SO=protein_coding / is_pseudo=false